MLILYIILTLIGVILSLNLGSYITAVVASFAYNYDTSCGTDTEDMIITPKQWWGEVKKDDENYFLWLWPLILPLAIMAIFIETINRLLKKVTQNGR